MREISYSSKYGDLKVKRWNLDKFTENVLNFQNQSCIVIELALNMVDLNMYSSVINFWGGFVISLQSIGTID